MTGLGRVSDESLSWSSESSSEVDEGQGERRLLLVTRCGDEGVEDKSIWERCLDEGKRGVLLKKYEVAEMCEGNWWDEGMEERLDDLSDLLAKVQEGHREYIGLSVDVRSVVSWLVNGKRLDILADEGEWDVVTSWLRFGLKVKCGESQEMLDEYYMRFFEMIMKGELCSLYIEALIDEMGARLDEDLVDYVCMQCRRLVNLKKYDVLIAKEGVLKELLERRGYEVDKMNWGAEEWLLVLEKVQLCYGKVALEGIGSEGRLRQSLAEWNINCAVEQLLECEELFDMRDLRQEYRDRVLNMVLRIGMLKLEQYIGEETVRFGIAAVAFVKKSVMDRDDIFDGLTDFVRGVKLLCLGCRCDLGNFTSEVAGILSMGLDMLIGRWEVDGIDSWTKLEGDFSGGLLNESLANKCGPEVGISLDVLHTMVACNSYKIWLREFNAPPVRQKAWVFEHGERRGLGAVYLNDFNAALGCKRADDVPAEATKGTPDRHVRQPYDANSVWLKWGQDMNRSRIKGYDNVSYDD